MQCDVMKQGYMNLVGADRREEKCFFNKGNTFNYYQVQYSLIALGDTLLRQYNFSAFTPDARISVEASAANSSFHLVDPWQQSQRKEHRIKSAIV